MSDPEREITQRLLEESDKHTTEAKETVRRLRLQVPDRLYRERLGPR
jgi:hypothetical protein